MCTVCFILIRVACIFYYFVLWPTPTKHVSQLDTHSDSVHTGPAWQ